MDKENIHTDRHTQEYFSALKENLAIFNNMDETGGHYAK